MENLILKLFISVNDGWMQIYWFEVSVLGHDLGSPRSLTLIRIVANCCELAKVANEPGRSGNRCHLIDRRSSHPHDYLAHKHIHARNERLNVDPLGHACKNPTRYFIPHFVSTKFISFSIIRSLYYSPTKFYRKERLKIQAIQIINNFPLLN